MRAFRTLCAGMFAALSLVLVGAGPSWACSCVVADTAGYVTGADVVLVGTLTGAEPPAERAVTSSADPVTYRVDVEQVLKGTSAPQTEVRSASGGASCGLEGMEPGRRYVFFAAYSTAEQGPADVLWADLCGGTGPASRSLVAEVEQVTGAGLAPTADQPSGTAYGSDLATTMPDPRPAADDVLADWALPIGLAAGASLLLLTGVLWLRLTRS